MSSEPPVSHQMQGNGIDETHIQTWLDEIEIQRWLEELLENAIQDCVSTLHFEISKGAGRIRQRKSSVMSMVADDISHQNYNRFIAAIKSRFDIDPAETRREQDVDYVLKICVSVCSVNLGW